MKLVTYEAGGATGAGVIAGGRILDATAALGSPITLRDVQAVLELDGSPLERLREAAAKPESWPSVALEAVRLRSPILRPPTVRDYMVFGEHASAQGSREPAEAWFRLPIFYFSNTLRIFGPDEEVPYPTASASLDYELELGCVIGREGSDVKEGDAMSHVAGFTIFNDWSCRDLQFDEMQVRLGPAKGKDSATSLGPWIVTADELAPYLRGGRLNVGCTIRVNGDTWLTKGHGATAETQSTPGAR
ncbi:MAG: fumarylacetoacetate hydrolase family protein [Chloroflexota bacterium]|nr:fumarylacetoacetate hydrolase family protein [Chloroflexota bacterium]